MSGESPFPFSGAKQKNLSPICSFPSSPPSILTLHCTTVGEVREIAIYERGTERMGFRRRERKKKGPIKRFPKLMTRVKKKKGGRRFEFSLAPSFLIRLGQGRRIFSLHFPVSQKYIWQRDSHGKLDITSASSFAIGGGGKDPFLKKWLLMEFPANLKRGSRLTF